MLSLPLEKKLLQLAVALACLVPISAGLSGMLLGAEFLGGGNIGLDSHFRYLSGLLCGIGLGFASAIPHIERQGARFQLFTLIVVIGGCGRLAGVFLTGIPHLAMLGALVMELIVTPLLCLWQRHLAVKLRSFT